MVQEVVHGDGRVWWPMGCCVQDMVLRRGSSRKELFTTVSEGLRQHYSKTLRPFEETHCFHALHSPPLQVSS